MPKVSKLKVPAQRSGERAKSNNDETGVFRCTACGTMYNKQRKNFPTSQSQLFFKNGGYLPVCGSCIEALFTKYRNALSDDLLAARRVCMKMDIYWDEQLFKNITRAGVSGSLIRTYIGRTNLSKYVGKTYDDTLREEAEAVVPDEIPLPERVTPEATDDDMEFWGTGYTNDEYYVLNKKYKYWTNELTDEELLLPGTQAVYRNICLLDFVIARNTAAGKPTESAVKQLNDLISSANATPAQRKKEDDGDSAFDTLTFGEGIRVFENERPIPKPLPEFEDVDNIRKYVTIWFLGHLCHMLHIKNTYCKLYEDEMNRLRVERPEFADEDDDDFLNDIFGGDTK